MSFDSQKLRYVFDIDGTICQKTTSGYQNAIPYDDRIRKVNLLFEEGHHITFFTSRGMHRNKGNVSACYSDYYELTKNQLVSWGVKFHVLIMGKPSADVFVDDVAESSEDYFEK